MYHYKFPIIKHIDDLLPAIEGSPEFIVAVKEGYTVINYLVSMPTTFPPILDDRTALRRECRGIVFSNDTGEILRRPYHKFFNVNEKDETQEHLIDLSKHHWNLEKLDGSMIVPFKVKNNIIWGTKMGDTEVAQPVMKYIDSDPQLVESYYDFASWCLKHKISPIFEWCSRKQRIVLDYAEDRLILTAMRNMYTGEYQPHDVLEEMGDIHKIPVVKSYSSQKDMRKFIEYVSGLQDVEGFVTRFADGHMIKLKCDWYCAIHKAKESTVFDRHIVAMIFDEKLDDVISHLTQEERDNLRVFENSILTSVTYHTHRIHNLVDIVLKSGISRKEFALTHAKDLDKKSRQIAFLAWDNNELSKVRECVIEVTRDELNSNKEWDKFCSEWYDGVKYNK